MLNMNATDFWLVMSLKWLPIRKCLNFINGSTMAYTSFSIAECWGSDWDKVLEKKSIGWPNYFNEMEMAQSDASVFTTKRTEWSVATVVELAIFF